MKTNTKRFINLNPHHNGGFTLVELIVVIAILAILAAVAVPAYSGYIEKANRAGDETLLATINKAFASACMENGFSQYEIENVGCRINENGTIGDINATLSADAASAIVYFTNVKLSGNRDVTDAVNESFGVFYSGNEASKFKVTNNIIFIKELGGFVDLDTYDGDIEITYAGNKVTISAEAAKKLAESTFGSAMGGESLLNEITGLTNMVNAGGSKLAEDLLADEAYMQKYAAYLGIENADTLTGDALENAVGNKLAEQFTANGIDISGENSGELFDAALVNGMVFYAAEGMKDYTVDSANSLLGSDNIYSQLSTDPATRLAEASLVYGMYAGFVNSDYNKGGAASSTDDPMAAIQAISGDGAHSANFQDYLKSEQGKADVAAYMEAMNVINNTSGNDAAASVLVNGFADSELQDLLIQVLGK